MSASFRSVRNPSSEPDLPLIFTVCCQKDQHFELGQGMFIIRRESHKRGDRGGVFRGRKTGLDIRAPPEWGDARSHNPSTLTLCKNPRFSPPTALSLTQRLHPLPLGLQLTYTTGVHTLSHLRANAGTPTPAAVHRGEAGRARWAALLSRSAALRARVALFWRSSEGAEGGGDTQLFTPPEREMRFVDMDD